jgi:hypothetical protein
MPLEYDETKFKEAQDHGEILKSSHSARNTMQNAMADMYLMKWEDEKKVKAGQESVAVTRSPSAHNKVEGAVRLLSTTAPKWSVPRETNQKNVDTVSSKIEQWVARIFECASRVTGEKIERSVAQSQILFGETVIAVDRTSDIVAQLEGKRGDEKDSWLEAAIVRAQRVADRAPYLFTSWDPRSCYPSFDKLGLQAFYREVSITAGEVMDEFGELEVTGTLQAMRKPDEIVTRDEIVTLCHYWDYVMRYVWLYGSSKPLVAEEHKLSFIPVVCQLGEGSRLLRDPENWRLPFLYAVWRSNQWSNENLYLTVAATATAAFGSNPMYTAHVQSLERQLDIDHSVPGGVIKLIAGSGEDYSPTPKMVIDQSLLIGLERARSDIEESTIYGQTLGQPLGNNATYSMTALLHQAGRLPLAVPQEMAGRALAAAGKIALQWCKLTGKTVAGYAGYEAELQPSDIPDNVELDCKLDVALPQDRLGNINVARMATDPSNQLASKAWAQQNILSIEQPDQMLKEIMAEQTIQTMFGQYLQQMIQQAQMAQQQAQQAQMQPPQGQPPQGQPGMQGQGIPPQVMAGGMQGPQPMPGEQQQLPPEMAGGENAPYGG